jgi:DNA helicase-2/ATP-dependent DNA helicase PcrA
VAVDPREEGDRVLTAFADLLDRLSDATESAGPGATLESVLTHTGYAAWWSGRASKGHSQDPLRNIGQLLAFAHEAEDSLKIDLRTFLEQTTLLGDRDGDDREKVTLLTVHAAKGLEYKAVILVGVEDDLIPHANARMGPGGLDEERRLLHVAMTRARRRLVLTVAGRRVRFGREQAALPSRFLRDLPSADVERYGNTGPSWQPDDDEPAGSRVLRDASDDPDDPLLSLRPGPR